MTNADYRRARNEQIIALFSSRLTYEQIGSEVGCTKDVVAGVVFRWRRARANLPILPSPPKPRRGDHVFIKAMSAAIDAGSEHATRGIITTEPEHFIPTVRPCLESGYRSSAGYTADQGMDNGGTSE